MQNSSTPFEAVRTPTRDSAEFIATSGLIKELSFRALPFTLRNYKQEEKTRLIAQFLGNAKTENITCQDFAKMVTSLGITDEDKKMILITEFLGSKKAEKNITCQDFAEMVTRLGITDEEKKMILITEFLGSDKAIIDSLKEDNFITSLNIRGESAQFDLIILKETSGYRNNKNDIARSNGEIKGFCQVFNGFKDSNSLFKNEGVRANLVENYIKSSTAQINDSQLNYLKNQWSITSEKYIIRINRAASEAKEPTRMQAQLRTSEVMTTNRVTLALKKMSLTPDAMAQQQELPHSGSRSEEPKRVEEDKIRDTGDNAEKNITCKNFAEMVTSLGISDEDRKIQMITEFLGNDKAEKNITCKDFSEMVTRLGISDEGKKMKLITEFLGSDKVQISSLQEDNFTTSLNIRERSAKEALGYLTEICTKTDAEGFISLYSAFKKAPLLLENEGIRANLIENLFKNSSEMITGLNILKKMLSINNPEYIQRIDKAWEDQRSRVKKDTPASSLHHQGAGPALTPAKQLQ